ncbi:MAG TPA: hypothetical protein VMU95_22575 [Trebonia sp.]|nr:hypothetical protein [Trebonia sp.]
MTGKHDPTRLERRGQLLLRCYPPAYRRDRGEEILQTLLEGTPAGRSWPSWRDAWSLVRGGLGARAARNRQAGLATSLRQAVVIGLAMFLAKNAGEQLAAATFPGAGPTSLITAGLVPLATGCLLAAAAAAAWSGRRALTVVAALAAAPILAWRECTYHPGISFLSLPVTAQAGYMLWLVLGVLAMAALVVLTRRGERPGPTWLSLPGLALALALLARFWHYTGTYPIPHDELTTLLVAAFLPTLAWLVTDVRPALGLTVLLLVSEVLAVINGTQATVVLNQSAGTFWRGYGANLVSLAIAAAITAAGVWLLRRQNRARRGAVG